MPVSPALLDKIDSRMFSLSGMYGKIHVYGVVSRVLVTLLQTIHTNNTNRYGFTQFLTRQILPSPRTPIPKNITYPNACHSSKYMLLT